MKKVKTTPYQDFLLKEGYIGVSSEIYKNNKREYLHHIKCLFCSGGKGSASLSPFKAINGRQTTELICNKCDKLQGTWYDVSGTERGDEWVYIPSTDTDIYHNRFDLHSKIKSVLLGKTS